jgi:hypothetical protein
MGGAPSQIFPIDSGTILNVREHTARSPALWLGGQDVICDDQFFTANDISWVLSLGPAAPPNNVRLAGREQVNLADSPSADLGSHFGKIVRFIGYGRHALGHNIYVHCAAGISRSTTSVCAYLMTHLGLSFEESLLFLTCRRRAVCPNQGFRQQLKNFERSRLRSTLAQELSEQCSWYQELRQADLDAVHRTLEDERSAGRASRAEQVAMDNAYESVQKAIADASAREGEDPRGKLGDGSSVGDFGLGWLVGRKSQQSQQPRVKSQSRRSSWSVFGSNQK